MQATDRGLSVFRHYLPVPFRIGKKFLNPLYKDTKASCNVYYDRRHSVYKMKDFGNEEYSGDCFELVGTMTGLSCRNAKDFVEIMRIIDHDLHLGLADGYENCVDTSSVQVVCPPTPEQVIKKIRPYNIVPRAFNETDRIFWSKSRITEHTLNKYNVRPLHSFSSVNQEGKSYTLTETAQEPMYGYVGDKYIKIYRPRSEMRFLYAGDLGDNYCFGLDQLSAKGDLLFITGGEKDVMSLAANGFHAICFMKCILSKIEKQEVSEIHGGVNVFISSWAMFAISCTSFWLLCMVLIVGSKVLKMLGIGVPIAIFEYEFILLLLLISLIFYLCYINELFVFKKDKYRKYFAEFDKKKRYLLYYGIYVVSLVAQLATFYLLLMEIVK